MSQKFTPVIQRSAGSYSYEWYVYDKTGLIVASGRVEYDGGSLNSTYKQTTEVVNQAIKSLLAKSNNPVS